MRLQTRVCSLSLLLGVKMGWCERVRPTRMGNKDVIFCALYLSDRLGLSSHWRAECGVNTYCMIIYEHYKCLHRRIVVHSFRFRLFFFCLSGGSEIMYNFKNDKLHAKTHYETMGFSFSVVSLLFCYYCYSVRNFRCAPSSRTNSRLWMHCSWHHSLWQTSVCVCGEGTLQKCQEYNSFFSQMCALCSALVSDLRAEQRHSVHFART